MPDKGSPHIKGFRPVSSYGNADQTRNLNLAACSWIKALYATPKPTAYLGHRLYSHRGTSLHFAEAAILSRCSCSTVVCIRRYDVSHPTQLLWIVCCIYLEARGAIFTVVVLDKAGGQLTQNRSRARLSNGGGWRRQAKSHDVIPSGLLSCPRTFSVVRVCDPPPRAAKLPCPVLDVSGTRHLPT